MSKQPIVRANPQTAEDKHPKHYVADWWIYAVLALFIGGLVFMTFALTLRGDVISEFGKKGEKAGAPAATAPAPAAPAAAPAEKK
ncbi:MAG: hypothetical protein KJZ92_13205 [Rhodocyclaceae bacterium]|jgi:hypothetical protein|nr:hypothetical protein [Rhodocyclaceae bacterium]MCL4682229.1 hypothetical protein [Rhodocyclaceae bacterium]